MGRSDIKHGVADSHAEPQRSRHVCLPVGTVEHKHPSEAAEEHPVWVGAQLHRYAGSQHHKHCEEAKQECDRLRASGSRRGAGSRLTGGQGVAAVVEQLAQRRAAVGAAGLLPVNGVQRLVDKKTHGAHQVRPEGGLGRKETPRHTVFTTVAVLVSETSGGSVLNKTRLLSGSGAVVDEDEGGEDVGCQADDGDEVGGDPGRDLGHQPFPVTLHERLKQGAASAAVPAEETGQEGKRTRAHATRWLTP